MTRRGFLQAAGGGIATAAQAPRRRPNLLILTNDQHRSDCLGCMGNPVIRTPNIDRLASQSATYTNHFVQTPQCVPSRVSLATGRYPHVHRTPTNAYILADDEQTLARILNRAGYLTAAVGEMPFAPRSYTGGFAKILANGADHEALLEKHGWHGASLTAERRKQLDDHAARSKAQFQASAVPWPKELDESFFFAEKACEFLRAHAKEPFFLHVNFRRPHHPFDPPVPYDRMYENAAFPPSHSRPGEMTDKPPQQQQALRNSVGFDLTTMSPAALDRVKSCYYGMITLNDEAIGAVLKQMHDLDLDRDTVVIFNSDHGEMLGDHGLLFKGGYMYDEVLHVPLILRAPGRIQPGSRVDKLCEEIDVLPTVLELLGVAAPDGIQGESLLGSKKKQAIFAEFPTIKTVRTLEWKLVHYPGAKYGELYNLKNDPNELFNLWADPKYAPRRAEMAGMLADWLIRTQDPKLAPQRDPSEKG